MFEIGKEYRVWPLKDGMGRREGPLLFAEGDIITIDVDGIQTTFHLATVACVERIDPAAEKAQSQKRAAQWAAAYS